MASINSMQVKDYLQALSDEGKIRVEKIGSGNWYWSFLSEEKNVRDKALHKLREEKEKIDITIRELQARVDEAANREGDGEDSREELLSLQASLTEELVGLKNKLKEFKDSDPEELMKRARETEQQREKAVRWADNLELLECWLERVVGGDKERFENIKRSVYGDEYDKSEGLRDL